jgi:glycosyltransferase involved in cell wall biosynthesis
MKTLLLPSPQIADRRLQIAGYPLAALRSPNDSPSPKPQATNCHELSVVMPVYNEEQALPDVLDEAVRALAGTPFSYEIVLVDDASTDGSLAIMEAFQQEHAEIDIRVLRHRRNQGIAAACATLFAAARGKYVFLNGSDGQCKTAECLRMMALRRSFDLVIGKRIAKNYTLKRALISRAFNLLPRLLFGVSTYDAGSIKLVRRDLLNIPLTSRGPFREAERIIRARRRGYRIGVLQVENRLRRGGLATGARWGLVGEAILDLMRSWWRIMVYRDR